jgi:hypothetical protein
MSLSIGAGTTCRDNEKTCVLHTVGRVDNAQALRACGPFGPRGFESHSRRQTTRVTFKFSIACAQLSLNKSSHHQFNRIHT